MVFAIIGKEKFFVLARRAFVVFAIIAIFGCLIIAFIFIAGVCFTKICASGGHFIAVGIFATMVHAVI